MLNQIRSTNKTLVNISKNSARSFYLGQKNNPKKEFPKDDCAKDFSNCAYFKHFNRKGRSQYFRFLNKVEANLEGTEAGSLLFLTLTFNTTRDDLYAFTTN